MNLGDECTAIHEIHGEAVLRPYRYPRQWSRRASGHGAAMPLHPLYIDWL